MTLTIFHIFHTSIWTLPYTQTEKSGHLSQTCKGMKIKIWTKIFAILRKRKSECIYEALLVSFQLICGVINRTRDKVTFRYVFHSAHPTQEFKKKVIHKTVCNGEASALHFLVGITSAHVLVGMWRRASPKVDNIHPAHKNVLVFICVGVYIRAETRSDGTHTPTTLNGSPTREKGNNVAHDK